MKTFCLYSVHKKVVKFQILNFKKYGQILAGYKSRQGHKFLKLKR